MGSGDNDRNAEAISVIVANFVQLGPGGREVLLRISNRLVVGKAHGDFKPKAWRREKVEELLDAIVYDEVERLQAADAPAPAEPPARELRVGDRVRITGPAGAAHARAPIRVRIGTRAEVVRIDDPEVIHIRTDGKSSRWLWFRPCNLELLP